MATPTLTLPDVSESLQRAVDAINESIARSTLASTRAAEKFDARDYADVVTAGVALLDERLGRDVWLNRVYPASLDLSDEFFCLVAQVTDGEFTSGAWYLGAPDPDDAFWSWAVNHGFALHDESLSLLDEKAAYRALTDAWVARVGELRAEGVA